MTFVFANDLKNVERPASCKEGRTLLHSVFANLCKEDGLVRRLVFVNDPDGLELALAKRMASDNTLFL